MKVLFIGGTGTIGTECSKLCAEKGINLWLISRGNRNARIPHRGVTSVKIDITKEHSKIKQFLNQHYWDCVVDWIVFTEDHMLRDIDMLRGRTRQFIFISSTSIYQGTTSKHRITENDPVGNSINPPYAQYKLECEKLLLSEHKDTGFPATIVRPGHTYAEFTIPSNIQGLGYGIVERFLKGRKIIVHDDGLSLWTLTHSSDFARGFIGLVGLQEAIGEVFHITSSEVLSWQEIFETFRDILGVKAHYEFIPSQTIYEIDKKIGASLLGEKAKNLIFHNKKIKGFVKDYSPVVLFKEGLRRSLEWHNKNADKVYFSRSVADSLDRIINIYEGDV